MRDTEQSRASGQLLTIPEVMSILQVSRSTIERLIKNDGLPVVKLRQQVRIRTDDLEAFILDHRVSTKPEFGLQGGSQRPKLPFAERLR